jgi:predicted DNA-binding transcriptional regulator YafY
MYEEIAMSSKFHLDLTPEEGILLLTGARLLDKLVAGIRIQSADRDELIDEVISKVAGHVPLALNRLSGEIADAIVDAVAGSAQSEESEILTNLDQDDSCDYPMYAVDKLLPVIKQAIPKRHSLVVEYYSFVREAIESYTLNPLSLMEEGDLWKLTAYCREQDQIIIFRVDRIKDLVKTEQSFEIPEGFDPHQPFPFAG